MSKHLVFVYGTLRRGAAGSMSDRFPDARFIADARVGGSLYDLGAFPGLLLGEADSTVVGEVYEVDEETLHKLDEFEASSSYLRKQVEVSLGTDKKTCWVYEPNPKFYAPRTLIASGDWLAHAGTKTDWPDETQS
jgi:gamma-glutamylcyclotransferase (GGCT)/AIG2-like uncharacterized protein YtfP